MKTNTEATPRPKPIVIAYGHMADLDGNPKIVVHARCWNAYAGGHSPYRLSYSSAFFEGAQNEQLRDAICFHCKRPFTSRAPQREG